ncbi:MAG: hypothetical protein NT045_00570 [Candidatus Aureabacteria bacterium]|nr:hypothetical protein [Candidatus Auribacterota bacterium]
MLLYLLLKDIRTRSLSPALRIVMLMLYLLAIPAASSGDGYFPAPRRYLTESIGAPPRSGWDYDLDGDGVIDYRKLDIDNDGVVDRALIDSDRNGTFETALDRAALAHVPRHLIICVDSVPFALMDTLWREGHFRDFCPPGRVIAPFPSDTNPAFAELFGTARSGGVEDRYFDRAHNQIVGGTWDHLARPDRRTDRTFHSIFGYEQHPRYGAVMYAAPFLVADHDLKKCRETFWTIYTGQPEVNPIILYIGSTDAIGHKAGEAGMRRQLLLLEGILDEILYKSAGSLRVSIFSDHGNNLAYCDPMINLGAYLATHDFRLAETLRRPGDVVVPRFGLVGDACLYTREEQKPAAARAAATCPGVEFAVHAECGITFVTGPRGSAKIHRTGSRYRYEAVDGDPLMLASILEGLDGEGELDDEGFADDAAWFAATKGHRYPDILRRLVSAMENHVVNTPDVILSIEDGYCYGSPSFVRMIKLLGTHGSARDTQTFGMAMTTGGSLPAYIRAGDLMHALGEWKPGEISDTGEDREE